MVSYLESSIREREGNNWGNTETIEYNVWLLFYFISNIVYFYKYLFILKLDFII